MGEAGGEIARDLVHAGAAVRGFDPRVAAPPGVVDCASAGEAVREADLVLSVNSAHDAQDALMSALASVPREAVWADLNTASAGLKRRLAQMSLDAGITFADVALMATVPGRGLRTPMLVSGPGSARVAHLVGALGGNAEVLEGPAGAAATRKLLRSVFFKGMAAAVVEALTAAEAAGCEEWLRHNIADELAGAEGATVTRLVEGSLRHAVRRAHEMEAASILLEELGVPPRISRASQAWLEDLQSSDHAASPARDAEPG